MSAIRTVYHSRPGHVFDHTRFSLALGEWGALTATPVLPGISENQRLAKIQIEAQDAIVETLADMGWSVLDTEENSYMLFKGSAEGRTLYATVVHGNDCDSIVLFEDIDQARANFELAAQHWEFETPEIGAEVKSQLLAGSYAFGNCPTEPQAMYHEEQQGGVTVVIAAVTVQHDLT